MPGTEMNSNSRAQRRWIAAPVFLVILAGCSLIGGSRPAPPEDAAKIPVRYQWSEGDVRVGAQAFNVYRSATRSGPFQRLNEEPIQVDNPEQDELILLYVDAGVDLGETYYYYIERLDSEGVTSKVTPVTPARAVLPLQREDYAAYWAWQDRVAAQLRGHEDTQPQVR